MNPVMPVLVAGLGAATVLAFVAGLLYPAYARQRELSRRIAATFGGNITTADLGGRRRQRGVRHPRRGPANWLVRFVEHELDRAAIDLTPGEIGAAMVILGLSGLSLGFLTLDVSMGVLAGAIASLLPLGWLRLRRRRREGQFRAQLPETVALLAATVRAGHSMLQGLERVTEEADEPTRGAIAQVVREIGLGASQDEALERLAASFPSEDLELVATAISVHNQVGGSLSRVLDEMAETLRDRARIAGDIRALTAQQRYSGYVLAALPVLVGLVLMLVSPDYIGLLFQGTLRIAAAAAGAMVVVGFLVMRKIAAIDV